MVTGSSEGGPTAVPGSRSDGSASLLDDLGLQLEELLPGGCWWIVASSAEIAERAQARFWPDGADAVRAVPAEEPGWESRLRGLGPGDGLLVVVEAGGWATAVRAMGAARLHPGPLVLVGADADDEDAAALFGESDELGVAPAVPVAIAAADRPAPALVLRAYREVLKSDGTSAGRPLPRLRVSTGGGHDERPVVDLSRHHPIGRRPGARGPETVEVAALAGLVDEVLADPQLPAWVEVRGPHTDPRLAAHVLSLATMGVPVRLADGPLPSSLAAPVRDELAGLDALDLWDPDVQERASIRLRRAAIAEHGHPGPMGPGGPRPPHTVPVSVLLASNRPDRVNDAVARIAAQQHRPLEVVVAAHGIDPDRITAAGDLEPTVVPVAPEVTLGEALQAITEVASGAVLVKMDDDDLYAATHVTDLVLALRYTGATLVGKAAEFVYLGALDVTVRRGLAFERFGGHVAGGAIALHRADLLDVGGWAPVPRAVDSRLLDAVQRAGGSVYRTHGLGFLLNRHGRDHAFEVGDTRYLARTVAQRAGADLDFADVLPQAAHAG